MDSDYIVVARAQIDKKLLGNADACRLYLYLLSKIDDSGHIEISCGEIQRDLIWSRQRVRTLMSLLKSTNKLTNKSTNKLTNITLCNTGAKVRCPTNKLTNKSTNKLTNKKAPKFEPPTQVEVTQLWSERGYHFNPESFIPFYQSKGWKVGDEPMKDWTAAMKTWELRWKEKYGEKYYYQISGQSSGTAAAQNRYDGLRSATRAILQRAGNLDSVLNDSIKHA